MIDKRMMYAYGQLVKNRPDGKRPGYRGSSYGSPSRSSSQGPAGGASSGSGGGASYGGNSNNSSSSSNSSNDARDTYRMSPEYNTRTTPTPKTTTPTRTGPQDLGLSSRTDYNPPPAVTYIGGNPYNVVPENRDERERQDLKQSLLTGPIVPENNFMNTIKKFNPIGLGLGAINPFLGLAYNGFNYLKDKTGIMNNQDFFNENVIGNYGYGKDDYKKYMSGRMSGLTNAYGRTLNEGEVGYGSVGQSSSPIGLFETTQKAGDIVEDQVNDEETIEDIVLRFQGADRTLDPTAAGVANTDELRAMIQERLKKLYT